MPKGLPSETNPSNFQFESKAPAVGFKDLHPSPGVGQKFKGKDTVPWVSKDGLESLYVRCKQCGFIVNKRVNSPGSGWGNDSVATITTIAGGTAHAKNPISASGCPLCNSSEFE